MCVFKLVDCVRMQISLKVFVPLTTQPLYFPLNQEWSTTWLTKWSWLSLIIAQNYHKRNITNCQTRSEHMLSVFLVIESSRLSIKVDLLVACVRQWNCNHPSTHTDISWKPQIAFQKLRTMTVAPSPFHYVWLGITHSTLFIVNAKPSMRSLWI